MLEVRNYVRLSPPQNAFGSRRCTAMCIVGSGFSTADRRKSGDVTTRQFITASCELALSYVIRYQTVRPPQSLFIELSTHGQNLNILLC